MSLFIGYWLLTSSMLMLLTLLFVLYFKLKRTTTKTSNTIDDKVLDWTLGITTAIIDFIANWLISIPCWEFPKKWNELVTHRLKRYKNYSNSDILHNTLRRRRLAVANATCKFLNRYDEGHCD